VTPPTVALIGATGHGLWHLRIIEPLHEAERLRLVALCDVKPVRLEHGVPVYTDHRMMLAAERPDVVVICTPPHTHLPIATDALRAGCDVLLEKPPTPTFEEFLALRKVVGETGRLVQVGFQALGSPALQMLLDAVQSGHLGPVTGVSAAGTRQRLDAYYARSHWAGKRTVDGHPSADGVLANVFAHAVMNCLAVVAAAGGDPTPAVVEAELYRCRDTIEVDDTAALRLVPRSGPPVLVAVSLCAPEDIDGEIIVHTADGPAELQYLTDRLRWPGDHVAREVPGRRSLLENLLEHRADPAVPLMASLDRCEPFTRWLDAMRRMPLPALIPDKHFVSSGAGPDRRIDLADINAIVRASAQRLATFSELGVAWAVPPHRLD
jgi:predicted dehydrogenase